MHETFSRRCARLGIPCWNIDLQTGALHEPDEPAAIAPFLRSPALRAMVQSAAGAMTQAQPGPVTPLPGWVLAPFVHCCGEKRVGLTIALILGPSICDTTQFNMACMSAGLDPAKVRTVCLPLLRGQGLDLEQTLAMLQWMHEDLSRSHAPAPATTDADLVVATIGAMVDAFDARDVHMNGHSMRVSTMAATMARALNLAERELECFRLAGLLHDVGKIGLPNHVLSKQGKLSSSEIALMQRHPELGYEMLKEVPSLADVLPGVLHHHERFDGFGYPHGLAGQDIPMVARVLALADTFDAMTCSRPYRAAMPRQMVVEEILRCAGTQFDPWLAERFVKMDVVAASAVNIGERVAA